MVRNKEILRSENRGEFEFERREVSGQHHVVCFGSYVLRIKYVVEMKCIDNMYLWDLTLCFFDLRIK